MPPAPTSEAATGRGTPRFSSASLAASSCARVAQLRLEDVRRRGVLARVLARLRRLAARARQRGELGGVRGAVRLQLGALVRDGGHLRGDRLEPKLRLGVRL